MISEKSGAYGRELFAWSANQHAVSIDIESPNSHAATHFERHKDRGFWALAQLAVARTMIERSDQAVQVDMGKPVGQMDLVPVRSPDDIVYFQRPNRGETWYPGVECTFEERPETDSIVVITRKIERAQVLTGNPHPNLFGPELDAAPQADLFSVYPGMTTPGVPDGNPKYVTAESISFWRQWALAIDPSEDVIIYDGPGIPEAYRQ